jgi:DNA-binding NarL/FixJ family response regulator
MFTGVHKMAKYKEKIINLITGEETYRDYTAAEVAEVEAAQAEAAARTAETEAKATARASALAKLAALGLSADEIAAL